VDNPGLSFLKNNTGHGETVLRKLEPRVLVDVRCQRFGFTAGFNYNDTTIIVIITTIINIILIALLL